MKKVLLALATSLVLLFGGVIFSACGESERTIQKVSIGSLPDKVEYLLDEPFDVTGGSFIVGYSDGSSETAQMTAEMCGAADTSSYGNKQVTVTYAEGFSVQVDYTVIYSAASNEFTKLSAELPTLNAVTLGDAEKIMAADSAWNALTEAEREYLNEHKPQAYSKVRELQRRLLPEFKQAADARVNEYFGYLNTGNYTEEAFAEIVGYTQVFLNGEFTTLAEVKAAEEKVYADIEAVEKKTDGEFDLEEYRESTLDSLLSGMKGTLYHLSGSEVIAQVKNYAEEDSFKARVDELLAPIKDAADAKEIDDGYKTAVTALRAIYIEAYAADAKVSLDALVTEGRKLAEEQLNCWTQETIGIRGLIDEFSVSYDVDNRWWIPMPYRLPVLREAVPAKLASAQTPEQINDFYETFAYEILRATLERNLELVYAIERNLNPSYDTNDALYWNNIADCWGASANAAFIYDGIVDEYVGEMYGTSDSNPYRFVGKLYRDGGPQTVEGLVTAYTNALDCIFVRLTGIEITTQPKTEYEAGEQFTVVGGVITLSYSSGDTQTIDMNDSMYDPDSVDMTPNGSYSVTLTFTVGGEQKTVTVDYTVAQRRITNVKIKAMPTVTTFTVGEEFTVAGGLITVTYNDAMTETVEMTDDMYNADDVDLEEAGRKELTLTFTAANGEVKTVTLEYTVIAPDAKRVTNVEIQTQPTKTEYELGDAFTVAGGVILVTYSDDTTETVEMTDDMYEEANADTTAAGVKELTLTFTVNEETKTVVLGYTVKEDVDYNALIEKVETLPAAETAGEEDIAAMQECIELYEGLAVGAKSVFETVNDALFAKYNAVQRALVPLYVKTDAELYQDSYKYLNRFNYEQTEIDTLDDAYLTLTIALANAETFATADEALVSYATVFGGLTEKAETVTDYAANSALTATELAEKVMVGNLYQVSTTGYAQLNIELREVSFAESEEVTAAIAAFRTALEECAMLEDAKAQYEAEIRTLFNSVLLDAYRAAAEANVKALVNDLRDTVKDIWGEVESFKGVWDTQYTDYLRDDGEYSGRTPEFIRVSVLYNKLTVKSADTMAELFANYEAAYIEMLTGVMFRNLNTVFNYNAGNNGLDPSICWRGVYAINADILSGCTYNGLIEEYQGKSYIEMSPWGEIRLWYWGYHPTDKATTVGDLVHHYNADMNDYLVDGQKTNNPTE